MGDGTSPAREPGNDVLGHAADGVGAARANPRQARAQLLSVHLVEGSLRSCLPVLRGRLEARRPGGLVWALSTITAELPARIPPHPTGAALIAAWESETGLDDFLATHPLAARLETGWHVRLQPLRTFGSWPALPGLGAPEQPIDDGEPVAVLTLGRLRLRRIAAFVRASHPAERQAVDDPGVTLATGLARPPRIVSTFSVWRTAREMRDYAAGRSGDAHLKAMRAHHQHPFHHESIFARFRPYGARGTWKGLSPLTETGSA